MSSSAPSSLRAARGPPIGASRPGGRRQEKPRPLTNYPACYATIPSREGVGIGDLDAREYVESDNPMAWALAAWMRQPKRGRAALRLRLLANILRSVGSAYYRRLLLNALRTYFVLAPEEQAEEQRLLESGPFGEVRSMYDTWLDGIEDRARQEGEHKGAQRALQHALMAVLLSRFPSTPEGIGDEVGRLQDPDLLDRLIRRAAIASSLDEVWPPRGH